MEEQATANSTELYQTPPTNHYMSFFKELSPTEARPLKKRVRIDGELHQYIMRVLDSVQNDKEIPVASNFPLPLRALKANIKKVARRLDIPVQFDPALDGGFVVRKAMVDEAVKGDRQGARLGEANKKEKK